jgi:hypothetical protein
MRPKKILRLIFFCLIALPALARAAEDSRESAVEPAAPQEQVLKERQHFNKLKRSTRNIYKVTMRSGVVFRLQTALGYISTIDLPEKALKVFIGDQELFKVEVYEKQVLVKPITDEEDAKSNLVIVTQSGRLAFDLSVGPPGTADFVLDFRLPENDEILVQNAFEKRVSEKAGELEKNYQAKEKKLEEKAEKLSEEKLKEKITQEVKNLKLKASAQKDGVQVNLLSLSQVGEKVYLRFSVLNYSLAPYKVLKVLVGAISQERNFLKTRPSGIIEFPSELSLIDVIQPDSYVYGVAVLDYRVLGKQEKTLFRILEDRQDNASSKNLGRMIELKDFPWFE